MCDEIGKGQMARWRKLGACVGCDENDYKMEDFVGSVPGSPVTATPNVEAKAEVEAETEADVAAETGDIDNALEATAI